MWGTRSQISQSHNKDILILELKETAIVLSEMKSRVNGYPSRKKKKASLYPEKIIRMKIIYQINTDINWENSGKANSENCNTYKNRRRVMMTEK